MTTPSIDPTDITEEEVTLGDEEPGTFLANDGTTITIQAPCPICGDDLPVTLAVGEPWLSESIIQSYSIDFVGHTNGAGVQRRCSELWYFMGTVRVMPKSRQWPPYATVSMKRFYRDFEAELEERARAALKAHHADD